MSQRSSGNPDRVEHAEPTPATIKQLYATAFECAQPECHEDLYKVNPDTGLRVLNSRVAHIHARRQGGPRWDPNMSEDANRNEDNLLLLCLLHAWEIDDMPELYPADLLRNWKSAQLGAYLKARRSWIITDEEAAAATEALDLNAALEEIAAVVPFNPRMRTRVEAWQLAARKGRGRRVARLTPLVPVMQREDVLAFMSLNTDPIVEVPPGQVRVLVGRMGAGKSENAARWWDQALQAAATDDESNLPLFFTARHVISGLEAAVIDQLGDDPRRKCRIVVDDLDSVTAKDASRILMEARELVSVWPQVSVLATARPGIPVADEERLEIAPWEQKRGARLATIALGREIPWRLWTAETMELLRSPLSALALAARIESGRDTTGNRTELLSGLVEMIVDSRSTNISEETWRDIMTLAVRILSQPDEVKTVSFAPPPRIRRMTETDLVVNDGDSLTFALPIFEQYFGWQAITSGLMRMRQAAGPTAFPRWRYALAFAIASTAASEQEALMIEIAAVNPAAAFWILDEIGTKDVPRLDGPSDATVAAFIAQRGHTGIGDEADLAIRAGLWFREAEKAVLSGVGHLAARLSRHHNGQLVQWGAWLESGYLTLARSHKTLPPPELVALTEIHPDIIRDGWWGWKQFRFPINDLGRWQYVQGEMKKKLLELIKRRTLDVPSASWLARERFFHLARFVNDYGASSNRLRPIDRDALGAKVDEWMLTVESSEWASWQNGQVDSEDVRWLHSYLNSAGPDSLTPPWPGPDIQSHNGKWVWQGYSSELTATIAVDVAREALIGYRQLVESNFPAFGDALGLYSILPARIDGVIGRFEDEPETPTVGVRLVLRTDKSLAESEFGEIRVVTRSDDSLFLNPDLGDGQSSERSPAFGQNPLQSFRLPLRTTRAATNIAYKWLASDLKGVGWLEDRTVYFAD